MTDKDIKNALKKAYAVQPSAEGRAFVKKYERRELHLGMIIWMQMKEMTPISILYSLFLVLCVLFFSEFRNKDLLWVMASFTPAAALIVMTGLGRSKRYRMEELEMTARFSLRLQKSVRLFSAGILGAVLFILLIPILKNRMGTAPLDAAAVLGCPYLLTAWGCMIVIRRFHGNENIYGCVAVAAAAAFLPVLAKGLADQYRFSGLMDAWRIMMIISAMLTIWEGCRYVSERSEQTWN